MLYLITRRLPLLGHVSLFWHLFANFFYKNKSVLPPTCVPGAWIFGRPSLEVLCHFLYKVVSLFLDLKMVVSDFSSDLDLFCHVIQSQAALACASCARSLGSGNRWSALVRSTCFTPSLLPLFVLYGQEVNQLSELYHYSCNLPWQVPSFWPQDLL